MAAKKNFVKPQVDRYQIPLQRHFIIETLFVSIVSIYHCTSATTVSAPPKGNYRPPTSVVLLFKLKRITDTIFPQNMTPVAKTKF